MGPRGCKQGATNTVLTVALPWAVSSQPLLPQQGRRHNHVCWDRRAGRVAAPTPCSSFKVTVTGCSLLSRTVVFTDTCVLCHQYLQTRTCRVPSIYVARVCCVPDARTRTSCLVWVLGCDSTGRRPSPHGIDIICGTLRSDVALPESPPGTADARAGGALPVHAVGTPHLGALGAHSLCPHVPSAGA